ncbi:glycosyltransferase family 33 protein [Lepidopterella palustris CBS 459.81]|uniref:Chitobiosyldiphosphodolichol beta-mannosyltransferase n=1 Tax=Lepidopterella palustris CBS 459.81 TaxID=1314670 RepID=A0A8E2JEI9_9PEZI|nr:glycosyltransferase family 33 protein [Lepidopterella palustris CBS 459.81]
MFDWTPKASVDVLLFLVVSLSSLFTLFLFTLPSQYEPYIEEFVEEYIQEEKEKQDGAADSSLKKKKVTRKSTKVEHSVQVVVLGDIGRSPRMQYHAISIAKHRGRVDLIGYRESEIHPDVLSNPRINIVAIASTPASLRTRSKLLFLFLAPLQVLWQAWNLYYTLGYRTKAARWMLVQNPPAIPTLAIASFICFFRNTNLVIDWHNFGYSLLALKFGSHHPIVIIASLYENLFSRFAYAHFAVTNAMARVLKDKYGVTAKALHDRPAALFKPLNPDERASFLSHLPETAQYASDLTKVPKAPWRLLVSSTSWTADEDFSILLDALTGYAKLATSKTTLPKILAIITGKGPLKEHYLSKIRALNQEKQLLNVIILTAWLSPQDYALLLGSADLGVSLHTSSSGVDLPMKVVDMFGAGLPVIGWSQFEAWPELVKEGENGRGFANSKELGNLLVELFNEKEWELSNLKRGAVKESTHRWDDEWDPVAGKLLKLVL